MEQDHKGFKLFESKCGNNRDNIISLATVSLEHSEDGKPIPAVRNVNAYYEDGVFYIVTYSKSNKMVEISHNQGVAFSVDRRNISGNGKAENLGWVLDPKNASLRVKLRKVFANWYDEANNEEDINFCYCAIHITKATLVSGHGSTTRKIHLDFVNRKEIDEVKMMAGREAIYYTFTGQDAIDEGRAYIAKWFKENGVDMDLNSDALYIFGSYNVNALNTDSLIYTLYLIVPESIKLTQAPSIKNVFGGFYARRFSKMAQLDASIPDFYTSFENHPKYKSSGDLIEQYLTDKPKLTKSTPVLLLLSLDSKKGKR